MPRRRALSVGWRSALASRAISFVHQVGGHIITSGPFHERLDWLGQPFCLAVRGGPDTTPADDGTGRGQSTYSLNEHYRRSPLNYLYAEPAFTTCWIIPKRRPIKCVCPAPFLIRRFRRRTRRASPNGNCGRLRQRHNARQGQRPVTHHAKRWLSHVPISPTDSETSESIDACAKTIGPQHHCLHRNDKRLL
jgi:hypothetical protein